jgi:hypothetical protein
VGILPLLGASDGEGVADTGDMEVGRERDFGFGFGASNAQTGRRRPGGVPFRSCLGPLPGILGTSPSPRMGLGLMAA